MRDYIIIGPTTKNGVVPMAIFGEITNGHPQNAHYLGCDVLYRHSLLSVHHFFWRRLCDVRRTLHSLSFAGFLHPLCLNHRMIDACISHGAPTDFIFCVGIRLHMLPPQLVRSLKKRYPESKMICYMIDSLSSAAATNRVSVPTLLEYLRTYDCVFTYDPKDAETYADAMRFIDIPLWQSSEPVPEEPDVDLYFCGSEKGRSEMLLAICARFREAQLRFRCLLSSVNSVTPPPRWKSANGCRTAFASRNSFTPTAYWRSSRRTTTPPRCATRRPCSTIRSC